MWPRTDLSPKLAPRVLCRMPFLRMALVLRRVTRGGHERDSNDDLGLSAHSPQCLRLTSWTRALASSPPSSQLWERRPGRSVQA